MFEHILTLGVKPNATTYSLLVDAHLANKDPKAALAVIDKMVSLNYHSKMYFLHRNFSNYYVWFRLMLDLYLQRIP